MAARAKHLITAAYLEDIFSTTRAPPRVAFDELEAALLVGVAYVVVVL
jgi:hypothetical protein